MPRHRRTPRAAVARVTHLCRHGVAAVAPPLAMLVAPHRALAEWGTGNWGEFDWGGLVSTPVPLLGPIGAGLLAGALVASSVGRRLARARTDVGRGRQARKKE